MRILMTTDTVGGVWTYCLQLAAALGDYDVEVVLAAKGDATPQQRRAVQAIANATLLAADFKLEWMDEPWDDVRAAGEWLQDLARSVRPDLIHLNDYCHAALAWEKPVLVVGHSCVVSWLREVRSEEPGEPWRRYRAAVQEGLAAADLVVAPSRHMLQSLCRDYGPLRRCRTIPNGCAATHFCRGNKQPFIFSAGRLWDDAKNLRTLVAAAPQLDWPVRVAGLPHPCGIEAATSPKDGVTWLGPLGTDQMAATYAEAAIYMLPALYEPFGLTVLEAALSGCALVLGDIPTLRENWSGAAVFAPPRDTDQLARAANLLCHDGPLRRDLAHKARLRGQQLTARRMAAAYFRSYRQLIKRAPAAAVA